MSTNVDAPVSRTIWFVGGAIALFANAAMGIVSFVVSIVFIAFNGFGDSELGDFGSSILGDMWPYLLADLLIVLGSGIYLVTANRRSPGLAWAPIAVRALILFAPAVVMLFLVNYLVGGICQGDGSIGFAF